MSVKGKTIETTADIECGDILMCPHGVLSFVTGIFDNMHWNSTMIYMDGDSLDNHKSCPWRVEFAASDRDKKGVVDAVE